MNDSQSATLRPAVIAVLAVGLVFGWQALNVSLNYDGAWSALFIAGDGFDVPPALESEDIYQFPDSDGYDGQFYHYIAHDPWMTEGLRGYVDAKGLRWRRILVPGLAAVLSFGADEWVDPAYFFSVYLFIGLGVYWVSLLALRYARSALWGFAFLAIPATAISVERMTVDVAVTALAAGYALYAVQHRRRAVWVVLSLAPLARETGLALIAGHAAWCAISRRWREVAGTIACVLPFFAWALYVGSMAPSDTSGWLELPFVGLVRRTLDFQPLSAADAKTLIAMGLDYAGVVGVWIALAYTLRLTKSKLLGRWDALTPVDLGVLSFAAAAVVLGSPKVWFTIYSFSRVLSPWLVFLLAADLQTKRAWSLVPIALMSAHVVAQAAVHAVGMIRSISGG